MNCKSGDLAIVVRAGPYAGRMVEVLFEAPAHSFTLPNGTPHAKPTTLPAWVVNLLGSPIDARFTLSGERRAVMQGVVADAYLRPLRGDISEEGAQEACELKNSAVSALQSPRAVSPDILVSTTGAAPGR